MLWLCLPNLWKCKQKICKQTEVLIVNKYNGKPAVLMPKFCCSPKLTNCQSSASLSIPVSSSLSKSATWRKKSFNKFVNKQLKIFHVKYSITYLRFQISSFHNGRHYNREVWSKSVRRYYLSKTKCKQTAEKSKQTLDPGFCKFSPKH